MLLGGLRDADLGAASVGDERMRGGVTRNFWKKIEGRSDGESNVNQLGVLQRGSEVPGEGVVDGGAGLRFADDFGAVPTGNADVCRVFAKWETKGGPDMAGAENGNSGDKMRGHVRGKFTV